MNKIVNYLNLFCEAPLHLEDFQSFARDKWQTVAAKFFENATNPLSVDDADDIVAQVIPETGIVKKVVDATVDLWPLSSAQKAEIAKGVELLDEIDDKLLGFIHGDK